MSQHIRALAFVACAGAVLAACSSLSHRSTAATDHRHAPPSVSSTSATSSTTSTTRASTTTASTAASAGCNKMTASEGQSQGAAGTLLGVITVTNTGPATCTAIGYASVALFGSGGGPLTVTIDDGLSVSYSSQANGAPATVTIAPSGTAQFVYQYSDVPSGTGTSCPTSVTASVTVPGATAASANFPLAIAPCDIGTIRVSPLYSGG